jgi:hypothetical protein
VKLEIAPAAQQCEEQIAHPDDGTILVCFLKQGHDGPHWDHCDAVTWRVVVEPDGTDD